MDKILDFEHKMAAHCETGTLTSLLNHGGLKITEPLIFGIANGIFFGYFETQKFPFPTFIVRSKPGDVRKKIVKRLGLKINTYKYKNPQVGEEKLDELLSQNIPVGAQVDFFYMKYLPDWQRVHINVHFVNIIGKKEDEYLISDSYFPKASFLKATDLRKGRWAKGHMAPKGFMYTIESIPQEIDYRKPVIEGIKGACRNMLSLPVPFIGIKGIYKFSNKLLTWPKLARDEDHLSHEIMKINILLEDQGTGGAGFRFMYATFLKEAAEILNSTNLEDMSKRMMSIGDDWRMISYYAAKMGKNRDFGKDKFEELSQKIKKQGDAEKSFFTDLKKMVPHK